MFPLSDLDLSSFISSDIVGCARDKGQPTINTRKEGISADTAVETAAKNYSNNNNNSTQKSNHNSGKDSAVEGKLTSSQLLSPVNISGSSEQQQSETLILPSVRAPKGELC